MSQTDQRLAELGIVLPPIRQPIGNYVAARQVGNILYVSGHGPIEGGQRAYIGQLGADLDVEAGRAAARLVALGLLRTVKDHLGDLDWVRQVIKINGYVNSAPDFTDQPRVIDAASQLLIDVLGERGKHARTAIGTSVLPFGLSVEIEAVLEVETD